jgi:hypothetical protein
MFALPPIRGQRETRAMRGSSVFVALSLSMAACGGTRALPVEAGRADATPSILAEVLSYELRQFGEEADGAVAVCIGVRVDDGLQDPSPLVMRRLIAAKVTPQSACSVTNAITLVAGPVEWLESDEVRVRGSYVRSSPRASTSLAYRVVFQGGRWVCLGPVVSSDPL